MKIVNEDITEAQTLTKHERGRAINSVELVNLFCPGVSRVSSSLLLASKRAAIAQKEAKIGAGFASPYVCYYDG